MKQVYILSLLILLPVFNFGQTNTDFWFAAPEVTSGHGDQPIYLRLTSFNQSANVTISEPSNVANFPTQNKYIAANSTLTVDLTSYKEQLECKPPNTIKNLGLLIHSTFPITAYYEEANVYNPEIFTLKGNDAMGTSFYIPGQNVLDNHTPLNPSAYNSFDIVATEDNTTVTITPRQDIIGHPAGITFSIILNKGQVYSAQATRPQGIYHLHGSRVTSDKAVCITVKDDSDEYQNTGNYDLTGDQIVPVNIVNKEYIVVRGFTNSTMNDWACVTATADNTVVNVNGVAAAILNAGETYRYALYTSNPSSYIDATQPVYVLHVSGFGGEAGSALLPPMDCTGSTQVAFTRSSDYKFGLIILTKTGAQGAFLMDGLSSVITAGMFSTVPGNPNFVYARVELPVGTLSVGAHIISNTFDIFHLGIILSYDNNQNGCSYGYFSDFASLNLGPDQTVCPAATVTFNAGPNRISYDWYYNGNPYATGVQTITVTNPGTYSVTVNDHGCMLTDEVQLLNYPAALPVISGITGFCQGSSQQLSVQGTFNSYLWTTGATTQSITVNSSGNYGVTVTNIYGCAGTTSVTVTVSPLPHLTNNPASKTICSSSNTNITLLSDVPGTVFTWTSVVTSGTVTGNSNSTQAGILINDLLVNTGLTDGIVKYSITPHANGCDGPVANYFVTVHPSPHLTNNPASKTICSSSNTNISLTSNIAGTDFTWTSMVTSGSVTGNTNSVQPGILINDLLVNNGLIDGIVKYSITPHANGCDGPVSDYYVTVHPVPALTNNPLSKSICSSGNTNIVLTYNVTGTLFTWTSVVTSGTVTGNTNSSQPGLLINDQLVNNGNTDGIVKYSITPHANGCDGPVVNFIVTVHPTPRLTNNPASKTICSLGYTNISLISNISGTLFTWTSSVTSGSVTGNSSSIQPGSLINDQLVNNGITDGIVKYSVTPHANGCDGPVTDYFVTVHPAPLLTNYPATKTICSSNNTNISLSFNIPGTLFTWTSALISGFVTGNTNSTQPGLLINDLLVNTGNTDGIISYTITPHANNCSGPVANYYVTVHPNATVNSINQQIICSGTEAQPVQLGSNVTTLFVDYTWTVSCDAGIQVCPGPGNAGIIPAVIITNTDIVPRYATYTITPSVAGCQGTPLSTYKVQVNPSPTVTTSPLSQQMCSGNTSTLVQLTSNVGGTTFDWTATPSSPALSGYQSTPGTGNIIQQTISNSSPVRAFVTYHVVPSSQSGMACPGTPADYKIYVNPLPAPSITGPPQVCQGQAGTVYSTPYAVNHDYNWAVTGDVNFTGNHTGTITVNWGQGPAGSVQLTETDQNYPTNCSAVSPLSSIIISLAPKPVIVGPANPCGQTEQVYSVTTPRANNTYIWTVSGGSATSVTNSSINVSWGNTNPVSLDVQEFINYVPGVTCSAHAPAFPVSLNLIPDAAGTISGLSTICQGLGSNFSVGSILNSDSYRWWFVPSSGVTIINNGVNATVTFDLTAGSGNLYVQGQKTGCASGPVSPAHAVEVDPSPLVTLMSCNDPVTTRASKPFVLKGGIPPGGTYSVDGVLLPGGLLDPSVLSANPSSHTITYTYTNSYNCTLGKSRELKVTAASGFKCKDTLTDPRDLKTYTTFDIVVGGIHRCWMSANLDYGTVIPDNLVQSDNCMPEKYCKGNNPANCSSTGGLYQWDELMNYLPADNASAEGKQGLCPPEWHVPTEAEWAGLITFNYGSGLAGWFMLDLNTAYGFHGKTEGILYQNLIWAFIPPGFSASIFWTSTVSPLSASRIFTHGMNDISASVSKYFSLRGNALPVRCVRDL